MRNHSSDVLRQRITTTVFAAALWIAPWAIPCGVAGLARPAFAQESTDEEARVLFRAGQIAFEDGRFQNALDSFRRAYALTRRANLLYNIGVSAERLRLDTEALAAYEQYLTEVPEAPDGPNRLQLSARMEIIRRSIAAAAAAAPREAIRPADATPTSEPIAVPVTVDAAVPSHTAATSDEAPANAEASASGSTPSGRASTPVTISDGPRGPLRWPWYGAGSIALVGAGVAIGAGVHLGGQIDTCDRAVAAGGSCSNADSLSTRRTVAIVSGSASAALGATLFAIGATRRRHDEDAVSFVCAPGIGVSVACLGSF